MWTAISLDDLLELIAESERDLSASERRLWSLVQVPPEKWALHPWGDEGGGFWVVGVIGRRAIWYNDIEDGFNVSRYSKTGTLRDYLCNQGGLQPVLWDLLHLIESGEMPGAFGPPRPTDEPG